MFSFFLIILALCAIVSAFFFRHTAALPQKPTTHTPPTPRLFRSGSNPILGPIREHAWESEAVFNPAAIEMNGRIYLLYRALGADGISRVGYASTTDGVHIEERLPYPIFSPEQCPAFVPLTPKKFRNPFTSPARGYDRERNPSGGGWGGFEDPRAVVIDNEVHLTCTEFNGWDSIRMTLATLPANNFLSQLWSWSAPSYLSPAGEVHKNWVLFPEKIRGKFAVLHALTPHIMIEYVDSLAAAHDDPIRSNNQRSGRNGHWDAFVRGAASPPVRTEKGWLLFYHGMDPAHPEIGYKVGAMLLDLDDPTKILYRSAHPILTPDMPYENDWKPGVIYASGAVIKDGTLFIYYGGGDKTVNVATAPLKDFLDDLTHNRHAVLSAPNV